MNAHLCFEIDGRPKMEIALFQQKKASSVTKDDTTSSHQLAETPHALGVLGSFQILLAYDQIQLADFQDILFSMKILAVVLAASLALIAESKTLRSHEGRKRYREPCYYDADCDSNWCCSTKAGDICGSPTNMCANL